MTLPPAETIQADDAPTGAAAAYALLILILAAGFALGFCVGRMADGAW